MKHQNYVNLNTKLKYRAVLAFVHAVVYHTLMRAGCCFLNLVISHAESRDKKLVKQELWLFVHIL